MLNELLTRDLNRAIQAVADGVAVLTPRNTAELINTDRSYAHHVHDGARAKRQLGKLTPRDYEFAGLIAQGLSNQGIAGHLTSEIT
ncbi:hypothetical protein CRD60_03045 [Bifidobacterium aemilianum]|uniref:Uncharacterized protein n=1 Tax=Bifidobacterium aemilianum TaxID=2493120 RepID=A0A366KA86_9BIFI|nr:hypothetical protein CRD60_03045 [Bifidobacterium aemilianum]